MIRSTQDLPQNSFFYENWVATPGRQVLPLSNYQNADVRNAIVFMRFQLMTMMPPMLISGESCWNCASQRKQFCYWTKLELQLRLHISTDRKLIGLTSCSIMACSCSPVTLVNSLSGTTSILCSPLMTSFTLKMFICCICEYSITFKNFPL